MRTRANQSLARVPRRSGGAGLFGVPRLEELVVDPERVGVLDAHITRVLRMQAIAALNILCAHEVDLLRDEVPAHRKTGHDERLLPVKEAAEKFGVNADWLYRHHKELPFTVRCGRLLRFSELGMDEFIRGKSR
jgi:predicted DNA-binding transcriptional regulator AlpA